MGTDIIVAIIAASATLATGSAVTAVVTNRGELRQLERIEALLIATTATGDVKIAMERNRDELILRIARKRLASERVWMRFSGVLFIWASVVAAAYAALAISESNSVGVTVSIWICAGLAAVGINILALRRSWRLRESVSQITKPRT